MTRYNNDPRTITARKSGTCSHCAEPFKAGAEIYYFPLSQGTFPIEGCGCGQTERAEAEALMADDGW